MSVVAACYKMHRKILISLKEEGKISPDKTMRNTKLKELIRLYGLERFRKEVKEAKLDIPEFLLEE
ncbi:MAG: hypothetical protein J5710_05690 [Treponema sp.]|nr:hypothetical protein [Treponema sp.]